MKTLLSKIMIKTMGIISICLLLVCNLANCQILEPSAESSKLETYDFHIKKHQDNMKTSKILIIGGGIVSFTGIVLTLIDMGNTFVEAAFTGEAEGSALGPSLLFGGGAIMLASIPFRLKANEHEKKANLLIGTSQSALQNSKINIPKNIGVSLIIPIN